MDRVMKFVAIAAIALVIVMSGWISQQMPVVNAQGNRAPTAFETEALTVSTTAVGLTAATYARAASCFFTNTGAAVRFLYDGTTPTTSLGHVLADGGSFSLDGVGNNSQIEFIRDDATDSEVTVTCAR